MTTGLRILLPRPLMKGRIALGVALLVLSNIPSGATCLGLRPLTSRYDGAPAAGKKRMRRRDPCVHIHLDSRRGALVIRRRGSSLGRSENHDRTPVRDSHRCIWKPALAVVASLTSALDWPRYSSAPRRSPKLMSPANRLAFVEQSGVQAEGQ